MSEFRIQGCETMTGLASVAGFIFQAKTRASDFTPLTEGGITERMLQLALVTKN